MDIQTKYGWQELYATALLETDWSKIDAKIQVAENGIRARLHEFSMNHGGTPEENQAIEDALHGLDSLRKEVAAWRGTGKLGSAEADLKHSDLRWNPATREWFCVECGRTSDHLTLEDARWELNQRDCRVPSVRTLKGWDDPST